MCPAGQNLPASISDNRQPCCTAFGLRDTSFEPSCELGIVTSALPDLLIFGEWFTETRGMGYVNDDVVQASFT